jgi:hypothetical protein
MTQEVQGPRSKVFRIFEYFELAGLFLLFFSFCYLIGLIYFLNASI